MDTFLRMERDITLQTIQALELIFRIVKSKKNISELQLPINTDMQAKIRILVRKD